MHKHRLWTKNFLIVTAANFFLYVTYYLLMVTITTFAADKFHASPGQAGLASSIFVVGILTARVFSGRYIEQIGSKNMLFIGFISFLITTCLYVLVNSMGFLLINRFLNGAAMGIASTATGTIVAKVIPDERRGEGTGYYTLSLTIAAAIGPFLGMLITGHASFYMNFIVCIIILAFSFIAVFFVKVPQTEFSQEPSENRKGFTLHNYFEIKAIPVSLLATLIAVGYSSILVFLNSYARDINLVDAGSLFFIIYAVFVLISRPFTGRWFDKKGENFVMYPAILLFAAALALLGRTHEESSLLLAGALFGLGYGTTSSSVQAIAVKVSPKDRIALATSTSFIFQDLGIGVGPFILGGFVPLIGYDGLYRMMSVLLLICLFVYYFLHGKKALRGAQPVDSIVA